MNKTVMYKNQFFKITLISVLDEKQVFIIENKKKIDILFEEDIKELKFV